MLGVARKTSLRARLVCCAGVSHPLAIMTHSQPGINYGAQSSINKHGAFHMLWVLLLLAAVNGITGERTNVGRISLAFSSEIVRHCANKRHAALTFDDGPSVRYTRELLAKLRQLRVRATFFILGTNAQTAEAKAIVREAFRDGHTIGCHTMWHTDLVAKGQETYNACLWSDGGAHVQCEEEAVEAIRAELYENASLLYGITGQWPKYLRPPYGYRLGI